jgi:biopolymer transport protein ExbD
MERTPIMTAASRILFRSKRARVEIIPLIDVIFFLLATFVLFTLSLNKILSVGIDLPETVRPNPDSPLPLILRVSEGDTLCWEKDIITRAELPARLADYKHNESARSIMIGAEPGVSFGEAEAIYEEVRLAKITKVTFDMRSGAGGAR